MTNWPLRNKAILWQFLPPNGPDQNGRWSAAEWVVMEPHLILGIGELLWDLLPAKPEMAGAPAKSVGSLGGAPANFSVMAGRLGSHAAILSRIGRDDLGRDAVSTLDPFPADTGFLQVDPDHPTGVATVEFKDGQPQFVIHQPAAWDFMELNDDWVRLAERADAICFGSLAQRALESRQTIQTLAAQTRSDCVRVFDVNLRPPFYSSEVIQESLELATVMKMNDAEVPVVLGLLGLSPTESDDSAALRRGGERLLGEFPTLRMVAITRGPQGSMLIRRDETHQHPGLPTKVADTVGAGDAFTAAMTHYLMLGADLGTINEAGNRWGSWVASKAGAMPMLSAEVLEHMKRAIEQSA
ncbi:carbohydrate kinase [Acidobacteria bacterium AB60]|nr:carbohydrate kinase [Acidobacteria bacterium AB60]